MKSKIQLKNIQIKSKNKFKKLVAALDIIEIECGIRNVEITLKNVFVCGDIKFNWERMKPMEKLLIKMIKE